LRIVDEDGVTRAALYTKGQHTVFSLHDAAGKTKMSFRVVDGNPSGIFYDRLATDRRRRPIRSPNITFIGAENKLIGQVQARATKRPPSVSGG